MPTRLAEARAAAEAPDPTLSLRLAKVLADDLPLARRDGGFVRPGCDAALDEARALRDESRRVIAALQQNYCDLAGTKRLKVKHNTMLGYFVEVPQALGESFTTPPLSATFVHRQTMVDAMRFSTAELAALEAKIAAAADAAAAREAAIFDDLAAAILAETEALAAVAAALCVLDVAAALAEIAAERDWTRPEIETSGAFVIEGGRHPVVETSLRAHGEPFVANACDLSATIAGGRIAVVTGPNMAGKSTYLRQNALIAVLAQMGAYVPAARARIGVVDRLFSRVGAADDLARGRSTFMVEMVETAAILNRATPSSLVILDEIGRGTATFDGLSIAWAVMEHLHEKNRSRAIFATPFPRIDPALAPPRSAGQPHDPRGRLARRRRVPARSGAGRGGPLLRHPGRQARRPARRRRAPRENAAGRTRGRRSRRPGPHAGRPAAVRDGIPARPRHPRSRTPCVSRWRASTPTR